MRLSKSCDSQTPRVRRCKAVLRRLGQKHCLCKRRRVSTWLLAAETGALRSRGGEGSTVCAVQARNALRAPGADSFLTRQRQCHYCANGERCRPVSESGERQVYFWPNTETLTAPFFLFRLYTVLVARHLLNQDAGGFDTSPDGDRSWLLNWIWRPPNGGTVAGRWPHHGIRV